MNQERAEMIFDQIMSAIIESLEESGEEFSLDALKKHALRAADEEPLFREAFTIAAFANSTSIFVAIDCS